MIKAKIVLMKCRDRRKKEEEQFCQLSKLFPLVALDPDFANFIHFKTIETSIVFFHRLHNKTQFLLINFRNGWRSWCRRQS